MFNNLKSQLSKAQKSLQSYLSKGSSSSKSSSSLSTGGSSSSKSTPIQQPGRSTPLPPVSTPLPNNKSNIAGGASRASVPSSVVYEPKKESALSYATTALKRSLGNAGKSQMAGAAAALDYDNPINESLQQEREAGGTATNYAEPSYRLPGSSSVNIKGVLAGVKNRPEDSFSGKISDLYKDSRGAVANLLSKDMGRSNEDTLTGVRGAGFEKVNMNGGMIGTTESRMGSRPGSRSLEQIARDSESSASDASAGDLTAQKKAMSLNFLDTANKEREASITSITDQITQAKAALEAAYAAQADLLETQKREEEIAELEAALVDAQKITPEEEEAQRFLNDLDAEEANINAQIRGEVTQLGNEPVPAGFLQGWQKAAYEKGNSALQRIDAKRIPLQQQLATAQMRRKQAEESTKTRVNFALDKFDRQDARRKEKKEDSRYEKEEKRKDEKAKTDRLITLSDGITLYDPVTGRVVLSTPKQYAPERETTPNSYREWELAGKPGTYQQWLDRESGFVPLYK